MFSSGGEKNMQFTATVQVTGAAPRNADNPFFSEEVVVTSATVGGVYDAMVEAAYSLYFQVGVYLMQNFPADYSVEQDYWYVSTSYPASMNPYGEFGNGSGSSLSRLESIVESVVHYRHLEISDFMDGEIKYLDKEAYLRYVSGVSPALPFYDIFETRDTPNFREYGYSGEQLDEVISSMGDDYFAFMRSYAKHRSILIGRKSEVVVPRKDKENPNLSKLNWFSFLKR